MVTEIKKNLKQVVILDVSGIYVRIHNQGYYAEEQVADIQQQYSDTKHWRVLVLD